MRAALLGVEVLLLLWLEGRRPLRRRVEPWPRRAARNAAIVGLAGVTVQLFDRPVISRLSAWVERRRWGLVPALGLPRTLELPATLALLDYTLYLWHVANHRVPALWRFHQVHHVDLDLDVTTAVRFHPGELLLSVGLRAAQVLAIGVTPRALAVWQPALLASVLFHHGAVALPPWLDRALARFVPTPRLHTIHHSMIQGETDSNWSSAFTTLWDHLHGTFRYDDVPQEAIRIGVPAFPAPVPLGEALALPFGPQRASWSPPVGVPVRSREMIT
ncbi:MAG: sterol desaturase family protein [Planctomycetes bacterium]|nr:sterol desaturase family protein [Planctomycetota bacterium]